MKRETLYKETPHRRCRQHQWVFTCHFREHVPSMPLVSPVSGTCPEATVPINVLNYALATLDPKANAQVLLLILVNLVTATYTSTMHVKGQMAQDLLVAHHMGSRHFTEVFNLSKTSWTNVHALIIGITRTQMSNTAVANLCKKNRGAVGASLPILMNVKLACIPQPSQTKNGVTVMSRHVKTIHAPMGW
eukprot:245346_1